MNQPTSPRLNQKQFQTSICSAEDSHVSLFQLLESGRVSKILEELCSSRYIVSHRRKDLDCYSWRMSKDSCQQTMEGVSVQSSHRLDELGYDCEWQVLNSKNFGVPQNRERVFIIGHLRGNGGQQVFPLRKGIEVFEREHGEIKMIQNSGKEIARVYDSDGLSPMV